jgi:HEAT repeat protein
MGILGHRLRLVAFKILLLYGSLIGFILLVSFRVFENQAVFCAELPDTVQEKRQLQEVRLPPDGAGLVEFLSKLSPSDIPPEQIEQLYAQLGNPSFAERERASKQLILVGVTALPYLRKALESSDQEVVHRAQVCIREIHALEAMQGLSLEAVRGIVRIRPPGAVAALLRYLPNASNDESLEEEIWYGLDSLTVNEGKIDPSMLAALKDVVPVRRAASACIVGHRGNEEHRAQVRKLLADLDPWVRLRAAQGLLAAKDKSGIPGLIALLQSGPHRPQAPEPYVPRIR